MKLFTFTTWNTDRDSRAIQVTINLEEVVAVEHWRKVGYDITPCRIHLRGGNYYTTDEYWNQKLNLAMGPTQ